MSYALSIAIILIAIYIAVKERNTKKRESSYNRNEHTADKDSSTNKGVAKNRSSNLLPKKSTSHDAQWSELQKDLSVTSGLLRIAKNDPASLYNSFSIPKRKGGRRQIDAPKQALMSIQSKIATDVVKKSKVHPAAKGYVSSVVENAKPHLSKRFVLQIDLMNFFPNIRWAQVTEVFKEMGYSNTSARNLAYLCCLDTRLPQGSPASPAISNTVAYGLDVRMSKIAEKYNLNYTRYADDITLSGDALPTDWVMADIKKAVRKEGFALNNKKTKLIELGKQRNVITGVSIGSGEKLTIPKNKKREIRQTVHYVLTRGLVAHQQHIGSNDPTYIERLIGYLHYWQHVEPNNKFVMESLSKLYAVEK